MAAQRKSLEQVVLELQARVEQQIGQATAVEVGVLDSETATYASYVEFGSVQRVTAKQAWWFRHQGVNHPPKAGSALVNPARPFMRSTVAACSKEWALLFARAVKKQGLENIEAALSLVGMKASADIRQTLVDGGTKLDTFDRRAGLTMELYEREAKGHAADGTGNMHTDKPLVKTGNLLNAIGYQLV